MTENGNCPTQAERRVAAARTVLRIEQMDCPTEQALIEDKLGAMPMVYGLEFNLLQRTLSVVHAPSALEMILRALRALGFEPELDGDEGRPAVPATPARPHGLLLLAALAAAGAEVAQWLALPDGVTALLALVALLVCGGKTYRKGWIALRNGNLNINVLMSIAVTGALVLRQWPEAAMVMVLFTIAELVEAKSLERARDAVAGLMRLAPETAQLRQADGRWGAVAASAIAPGSIVRVMPGERLALDGKIVRGRSSINQAPITGESLPVEKVEGDPVFAATINQSGSFDYEVTAWAKDSTLARIMQVVDDAQRARAPTQRWIDQFAKYYTPLVLSGALAVALLPPLLAGGVWQDWIYKALVLLVIACPCALVISTPVTIVSGLAAAARMGILVKGGSYLEQGRLLRHLALDKTGTITRGMPVQTDFEMLNEWEASYGVRLARSLAAHSGHPVSRAIAEVADPYQLPNLSVEDFVGIPGLGVQGKMGNATFYLGNWRLLTDLGLGSAALQQRIRALEQDGKTVVVLTDKDHPVALFAVADTLKPGSRAAIAELHQLGVTTLMLTGDNLDTAEAIAKQVGIAQVRAELLPEEKQAVVAHLGEQGVVGMVGDGINDAPALARADIGFAMGALGTGTAIETADVALMDDDLRKIPAFIRLSRRTRTILLQNIVLALGIKGVFLALAVTGAATMWMAVFADVGASLLVVANGLRLLRAAPGAA